MGRAEAGPALAASRRSNPLNATRTITAKNLRGSVRVRSRADCGTQLSSDADTVSPIGD